MRFLLVIPFSLLLASGHAMGAVIISWDSVTIVDDGTTATVTGMTTGDVITPFEVLITTANGSHDIDTVGPLGTFSPPLNIELISGTRSATTELTVEVSIPGFQIVNPDFTLLDIDASPGSTPPFSGWQDEVVIDNTNLAVTLSNSSFTAFDGTDQILGIAGNVPNSSTDGNVLVEITDVLDSLVYFYSPGPDDQFGSNQRHGLGIITIESITPVPEPGSITLLAAASLGGYCWWRRRRRRSAT